MEDKSINEIAVSVIIPVYNSEKYIQQCLETVAGQTLKNIEIICINDNSSDNSLNILTMFSNNDSRIKVYSNYDKLGAGVSRNKGLALAKGQYITFLDADDYFEKDFLKSMYTMCYNDNSDVGVCDCYWIENSCKKYYPAKENNIPKLFSPTKYNNKIFSIFLDVPWNKIYRRKFILENNIIFQDLPNSNDVYFANIVLLFANKITYINKAFIYYRCNIDGQISRKRNKNPFCIFDALKAVYVKFESNEIKKYLYMFAFKDWAIKAINSRYYNADMSVKELFKNYILDGRLKEIGLIFKNDYIIKENAYGFLQRLFDSNELYSANRTLDKFEKMLTSRIDVKLFHDSKEDDVIKISDNEADISAPDWFQKDGKGYVVISKKGDITIDLGMRTSSDLFIYLRGIDIRQNNIRIPYWIDYTKFSINGEEKIIKRTPAWYDTPLFYSYQAKAGEIVSLHVEWEPHIDTRTVIEPQTEDDSNKIQELEIANKALNNKIDVLKKTIKILSN